jgi:hypothetical protein
MEEREEIARQQHLIDEMRKLIQQQQSFYNFLISTMCFLALLFLVAIVYFKSAAAC